RARAMPKLLAVGLRFADCIVAVSDGVADDLAAELGLDRARIEVVYNPVDVARLTEAAARPAEVDWPPGTGPRLLAVGRLIEQKDFPTLLRAVAELSEARLLVLGDGELRPALEALAEELGVAARVRFAGLVDNPFPLFRAADVFVLSSAWEGLPTVVIEALALTPRIVATDCPSGPREILGVGRWGRLVSVGDADALARGVIEELATPLRDRDGALARYDRGAVTDRYLALVRT
ncbi:MAG TPA: glycosyltransferase, partial [Acidimicrobiales bacterium]|nr:glycosyltransferase [Acidimicrobiales bacterium]